MINYWVKTLITVYNGSFDSSHLGNWTVELLKPDSSLFSKLICRCDAGVRKSARQMNNDLIEIRLDSKISDQLRALGFNQNSVCPV